MEHLLPDLKKTIAVLLEDMMARIDRIEERLDAQSNGSTSLRQWSHDKAASHHIVPREPQEVRSLMDNGDRDQPVLAQGEASSISVFIVVNCMPFVSPTPSSFHPF